MNHPIILLLEDQPLIALDLEDALRREGFAVYIVSSCEAAEAWLEANIPDVAVLDIKLRDGVCTAVAKHLVEHSVPFVVHSGSGSLDGGDDIFRKGIAVSKPCDPAELANTIRGLLGRALDRNAV